MMVFKVGGSLFDLPDLAERIRYLLALVRDTIVLVPGGGDLADAIRKLDHIHSLGQQSSHWLALRTLQVTAQFLNHLLPEASIIQHPDHAESCHILDPYYFAMLDESDPNALPHIWDVTSDSIALRVAIVGKAEKLVLLKSTDDASMDLVDPYFQTLHAQYPIPVEYHNLRSDISFKSFKAD